MSDEALISEWSETVQPEWCDYNGHMNVAFFALVFDNATNTFFARAGLGEEYRKRANHTTFGVDMRITFSGEGNAGDRVHVTTQLLAHDEKRIHYFHTMYNDETGKQMATSEQVSLHVDLASRKVVPWPPEVIANLAELDAAHSALPAPKEVGRRIGLAR